MLLVAGAYLLPRKVHLERNIAIAAPPAAVFAHLNDLRKHSDWSPWEKMDPSMKLTFTGPDSGVGQKSAWESKEMGSGSQQIVESVENEKLATELDFGEMGTAQAFFLLSPEGGNTRVTWGFDTDLGMNPMSRWFGLMFEKWIGTDYEKGLSNLKQVVESGK